MKSVEKNGITFQGTKETAWSIISVLLLKIKAERVGIIMSSRVEHLDIREKDLREGVETSENTLEMTKR